MERPEWMVKAARKIDGLYYEWFLDKLTKKGFPEPDEQVPKIEAIIDNLRPPKKKAAGGISKWMMDISAEIYQFEVDRLAKSDRLTAGPIISRDKIEAIILKYCPEDKAEKMAKALRETKAECYGATGDGLSSETCHLIDAALAEYEKTGATQVERVEIPTDWVKTAAEEIYRENKIRVAAVKDGSNFAPFLPESIEAIILKHCPEEQAAEKLVEGIKSIASVQPLKADPRFYELNGGPIGVIAKMVREARITIAEYEKTGATQIEHVETLKEKMAEKLLEDLLLVTNQLEIRRGDSKWNTDPCLLDDDVLNDAYITIAEYEKAKKEGRD